MILKVQSKVTIATFDSPINAVVVEHGLALITQDGVLAMLIGEDGMQDAELAGTWRRILFYREDTRIQMVSTPFEDEDGNVGIGYDVDDVIRALYEFSETARQEHSPEVAELGERARDMLARFATLGLYISIEQLSGTRVSMM